MVEPSLNKKRLALTLFLVLLTMNTLYARDHILDRKVLSNKMFNCSRIYSINLFIDDGNNTFVLIGVQGENRYGNDFLYMNNKWEVIDEQGKVLNGFIKDGYFHLAFQKDEDVVIYNIQKDMKFVSRIKSHIKIGGITRKIGSYRNRVIPLSDQNSSYYFLSRYNKFSANPWELFKHVTSGHGTYYTKPFLAEIQDDTMLKSRKIRYGGKIDESFVVKEAAKGKDSIHFLGFRGAETPETSGTPGLAENKPVILHYADYDLKKKKTVRKHSIYENTSKYDKNSNTYFDYGLFSIDNLDDDVFVVFSLVEMQRGNDNIKSYIYYCQSNNSSFSDIEKIGNGFLPLLRADFLGNVHVVWIDSNGGLAHKVKRNDGWSEEKIILNNVDIYSGIISTRYISAEFDKENNLHVVYPSGGSLVHTVVKVN
jgi:hypothetical protein